MIHHSRHFLLQTLPSHCFRSAMMMIYTITSSDPTTDYTGANLKPKKCFCCQICQEMTKTRLLWWLVVVPPSYDVL
ncbi:unnamed protein product [Lactuca virosa]|uniref:Uncharacterized protein n=1 Tax=Lactuca virosa TaxID=75947 RepID=A0AAU9PTL3_9ASTR|nr:unnamed protein product [Lactuca virosa]